MGTILEAKLEQETESQILTIQQVKEITETVEGFLTDDEGALLYNFANKCTGKGAIVEIGSWKGRSAIWLGHGSKNGSKMSIFAIDPHTGSSEHQEMFGKVDTFREFEANIAKGKVDDIVTPIVKGSLESAQEFNQPVEMIFIDGAHEYDLVKEDFYAWFPKVVNGGYMLFHDTVKWEGPRQVVKELIFKSRHFKNAGFVDSITFAQKVEENTLTDRLKNRYVLLIKDVYQFFREFRLPKPIKKIGRWLLNISGRH